MSNSSDLSTLMETDSTLNYADFIVKNEPSIILNTVFTHKIDNCRFGTLPKEKIFKIFDNELIFSHFINPWLAHFYALNYIPGYEYFSFTDKFHSEIRYEQLTFTTRGCRFTKPSMFKPNEILDSSILKRQSGSLIYIIVENINFPNIKVKFISGADLFSKYPKGEIDYKQHKKIFG